MKNYVVELNEKLAVAGHSHKPKNAICDFPDELIGKSFKIVDNISITEVPRVSLDENGDRITEEIIDENGDTIVQYVYEKDENGDVIIDEVSTISGKKAVLDEEADAQRLIDEAQAETDNKWSSMREERDRRLAATDHIMLPDYPATDKTVIKAYRQALRDLPNDLLDINNFTWPVKPE